MTKHKTKTYFHAGTHSAGKRANIRMKKAMSPCAPMAPFLKPKKGM
jgi:hypothetical protein